MNSSAPLSPIAPQRTKLAPGVYLLLAAGLLCVLVLLYGWWGLFRPLTLDHAVTFRVESGASFRQVAAQLHADQLIPNVLLFRVYARGKGMASQLKSGEYEITGRMRPVDVLALLVSGHTKTHRLTIPEGKWASEIPGYLAAYWPRAAEGFLTLTRQPEVWREKVSFPIEGDSLEGYLFPDSYDFAPSVSAAQVVEAMLARLQATCWSAYQANPPKDGRSFYQVLILASLVESEAKIDRERPIIAGVYMNRLRTPGWRLDCDATLIYARQTRITRVLNRDKAIDSPYNSYRRQGLPPGPICNPGLKSFLAALDPAETDDFFYVARGDGSHLFSRTLREQSANIQRVRNR